jgi:hypothetical protein
MVRRKETYRLSLLISFNVGEAGVSLDLVLLREVSAHVLDEGSGDGRWKVNSLG